MSLDDANAEECLDDNKLRDFLVELETLGDGAETTIDASHSGIATHLAACSRCASRLSELSGSGLNVETLAATPHYPNSAPTEGVGNVDTHRSTKDSEETTYSPADLDGNGRSEAMTSSKQLGRFGEYVLLDEVARGGMGVVFRARQPVANRIVALKVILSGKLSSDLERARFQTEVSAAASLDHPCIVPVYDVGEVDGQAYYTMAFIDGSTLSEPLRSGPLEPREAANYMRDVARALHHAHSQNIVHRDLKPANILVDRDGVPKITDFGLARNQAESGLTMSGQVLGTPSFMPPEQALGALDRVGPLSDVYSLGATLYALLTARPPFQAANVVETLRQVNEVEPLPPSALNTAVDRDLETICLKCLQKLPEQRYASAEAVADDLERFLNDEPITARAVTRFERAWRWRRRNPVLSAFAFLAAAALSVALAVSVWFAIYYSSASATLTTQKEELEVKGGELEKALGETEQQRDEFAKVLSQTMYDDAQRSCLAGDSHRGLQLMAQALTIAPKEEQALSDGIRYGIAAWSGRLPCIFQHSFPAGSDCFSMGAARRSPMMAVPGTFLQLFDHRSNTVTKFPRGTSLSSRAWLHPDGEYVAVSDSSVRPSRIKLFRCDDQKLLAVLAGNGLIWSFDGDFCLIYTTRGAKVSRFQTADLTADRGGNPLRPVWEKGPSQLTHAVHFPDGRLIAAASVNVVRLVDPRTLAVVKQWKLPVREDISDIALAGNRLFCSTRKTLYVVDMLSEGALEETQIQDADELAYDQHRDVLIVGNDKRIRFFKPQSLQAAAAGFEVLGGLGAMELSGDGSCLLIRNRNRNAIAWRMLPTPPLAQNAPVSFGEPNSYVQFARDVRQDRVLIEAASLRGTREHQLFDPVKNEFVMRGFASTGTRVVRNGLETHEPTRPIFMATKQAFVRVQPDTGIIYRPSIQSDEPLFTRSFDRMHVDSSDRYFFQEQGGQLKVWDLQSPQTPRGVLDFNSSAWPQLGEACCYWLERASNGMYSTGFERIQVDGDGLRSERFAAPSGHPIQRLRLSPDKKWLAACSAQPEVLIWSTNALDKPFNFSVPGMPRDTTITKDNLLAAVTMQGRVKVWDLEEKRVVGRTMAGPPHNVGLPHLLQSTRDGDLLVSGSAQRQLWHTRTGMMIGPPFGGSASIRGAYVSDSGFAMSFGTDGLLWNCRLPRPVLGDPMDVRRWVTVITGRKLLMDREIDQFELDKHAQLAEKYLAGGEDAMPSPWPPLFADGLDQFSSQHSSDVRKQVEDAEADGWWGGVVQALAPYAERLDSSLERKLQRAQGHHHRSLSSLDLIGPPFRQPADGIEFTGYGERLEGPGLPFGQWKAFTIECWLTDWIGPLISQGPLSQKGALFLVNDPQQLNRGFGWRIADAKLKLAGPIYRGAFLGDGTPHHWAMVWDGAVMRFYVDGHLQYAEPSEAPPKGSLDDSPYLIGALEKSPRYGRGRIHRLRVSSKARYKNELDDPFAPDERWATDRDTELLLEFSGFIGEGSESRLIADQSGHNRDARLVAAWWRRPNPTADDWRPESWKSRRKGLLSETKEELELQLDEYVGFIERDTAMVQVVPQSDFSSLNDELAAAGYRAICVRPWRDGDKQLVSACWVRDGAKTQVTWSVDVATLQTLVESQRAKGLTPIDIAVDRGEPAKAVVVWRADEQSIKEPRIAAANLPYDEYRKLLALYRNEGYGRIAARSWLNAKQASRYTLLMGKPRSQGTYVAVTDAADLGARRSSYGLQLGLGLRGETEDGPSISSIFVRDPDAFPGFTSAASVGADLYQHRARCLAYARDGYRPQSIDVRNLSGAPIAASLWHKKVAVEEAK